MPVHVVTEADHDKWVKGEWPEDFERVCTGVFLAFNPDGRSSEYCLTAVRSDDLRSQEVVIKWCKIQQCTKKPESDTQPRCDIWSCYTLHALAHLKDAGEGGESWWKAFHTFSWKFYQDLFVFCDIGGTLKAFVGRALAENLFIVLRVQQILDCLCSCN